MLIFLGQCHEDTPDWFELTVAHLFYFPPPIHIFSVKQQVKLGAARAEQPAKFAPKESDAHYRAVRMATHLRMAGHHTQPCAAKRFQAG